MAAKSIIEILHKKNSVTFKIKTKRLSQKNIDGLTNITSTYLSDTSNLSEYIFDLSYLEWIGHECIIYLCALFNELYNRKCNFRITLRSSERTNRRQALLIISLWENWNIYSFIKPDINGFTAYNQFFDIDGSYIQHLRKNILEIETNRRTNYNRSFQKIKTLNSFQIKDGYSEESLNNKINEAHKVDEVTLNLLKRYHSETPFLNKTLSIIISKELIENSFDHAFDGTHKEKTCYFGISLKNKIDEIKFSPKEVSSINKINFEEECLEGTEDFYKGENEFLNKSYIQYSFVDFGQGIPKTLKKSYNSFISKNSYNEVFGDRHFSQNEDTKVLEYAFNFESSRNSIDEKFTKEHSIPRGLYDLLSVVKRYQGVIIARSGYGKILYNFAKTDNISRAITYFGNNNETKFTGLFITILIPERIGNISSAPIKPEIKFKPGFNQIYYYDVHKARKDNEIVPSRLKERRDYKIKTINRVLSDIDNFIESAKGKRATLYFDFFDTNGDYRIYKKIIMFLASDYRINSKTNAVIINPPNENLIESIKIEIINQINIGKYIYHPIPLIYMDEKFNLRKIDWLGVQSDSDIEKISNLLFFSDHDYTKNDFNNPELLTGNIFGFDEFGNLQSNLKEYSKVKVEYLVTRSVIKEENTLYLCAGNYYQDCFVSFIELLQDSNYAGIVSDLLLKRCDHHSSFNDINCIICITFSSQLLAKALINCLKAIDPNRASKIKLIRLSNYNSFEKEYFLETIDTGDKVLLACDVISTGHLVVRLKDAIRKKMADLKFLAAVVDTRVQSSTPQVSEVMCHDIDDVVIETLYDLPIKKYTRDGIENFNSYNIIRVNPITNSPNILSKNHKYSYKILIENIQFFLDQYPGIADYFKIGCFQYNNVFHSYFFDTHSLFQSDLGLKIIKDIFFKWVTSEKDNARIINYLCYPIYSGVEVVPQEKYKEIFFNDFSIDIYQISRFITPNGWRFAFPPKFLNDRAQDKNILVIDDAAASGLTISQIIDEFCALNVASITFISIFGRLDDHQLEFFSRSNTFKSSSGKSIPVNIIFATNWNIPVYPLGIENPFYRENEYIKNIEGMNYFPDFIKNSINDRKKELEMHHPFHIPSEYDKKLTYLPKIENNIGELKIPYKDLFIVRDQIGKLAGYRLYKEYFECFDDIIKLYHQKTKITDSRYKSIELILAVISHEPYLANRIREIVPDVFEKAIEFVSLVAIDHKIKMSELFYKWHPQSFIRLFFILNAYCEETITSHISLKKLLSFTDQNYHKYPELYSVLFYYILKEIPHSIADKINLAHGPKVATEIDILLQKRNELSNNSVAHLKQFSSLLKSNPYLHDDDNEMESLKSLERFFLNEKIIEHHNDAFTSQFARLQVNIDNCREYRNNSDIPDHAKKLDLEISKTLKEWDDIKTKVEEFLRYMANLENFSRVFFNGKLYNISHKNEFSIQSILTELNHLFFTRMDLLNDNMIEKMEHNLEYIIRYLTLPSSAFIELFTKPTCMIYDTFLTSVVNTTTDYKIEHRHKIDQESISSLSVNIPQIIVEDQIFGRIKGNFRHALSYSSITHDWKIDKNNIFLTIKNPLKNKQVPNQKYGLLDLTDIEQYYDFKYSSKIENDIYVQTLKFRR